MSSVLLNKQLLLTRSKEDNERWAHELEGLRDLGLSTICHPCISRHGLAGAEQELQSQLPGTTWALFSSKEAVRRLAATVKLATDVQVACVGPASAELALQLLGRCEFSPQQTNMIGLATELALRISEQDQLLVVGARNGIHDGEELLCATGAKVLRSALYETHPATLEPGQSRMCLADRAIDAILVGSPSALEGLLNTTDIHSQNTPLIALGPTTAHAIRDAGLALGGIAKTRDLSGMLDAYRGHLKQHNR